MTMKLLYNRKRNRPLPCFPVFVYAAVDGGHEPEFQVSEGR
jgi:hypothetical protein